jgi:hypothetical protein
MIWTTGVILRLGIAQEEVDVSGEIIRHFLFDFIFLSKLKDTHCANRRYFISVRTRKKFSMRKMWYYLLAFLRCSVTH